MRASVILAIIAAVCTAVLAVESVTHDLEADPISCSLCTAVVTDVKIMVGNNMSQSAIKAALDKVCAAIPFAKDICTSVLEPLAIQILQGFVKKQSAAVICTNLKLCAPPRVQLRRDVEKASPIACALCSAVITEVKATLGKNVTQASLKQALEKVCSKIPMAKDICLNSLEPFVTTILQGLLAKDDAGAICKKLKVCNPLPQKIEHQVMNAGNNSLKCSLCTAILTDVKKQLGSNISAAALKKVLDKVCSKIPFAKDLCKNSLEPYITQILQALLAQEDPATVCLKIKLCKAAQAEEKRALDMPSRCSLCVAVITSAKNILGSNQTQAGLKKALDNICAKIPFAKDLCTNVLEPYALQIFEGLVAKQSPAVICTKLKLCNPTKSMAKRLP